MICEEMLFKNPDLSKMDKLHHQSTLTGYLGELKVSR